MMGEIIKSITLNPLTGLEMSRKAVKINPNNGEAYSLLGFALSEAGLFKEAETVLQKAKELDPLSQWMKGSWFQYFQLSRNIEGLKKFSAMFKDSVTAGEAAFSKAYAHFLKEEFDSVLLYSKKYDDRDRDDWSFWIGISYAGLGQKEYALNTIDTMKARSTESGYFQGSALTYAWMNEKEKAMDRLEKSYELRNRYLKRIKVDKIYDPLRNEPRFKELLRKIGLEE
jgi:tetratricopeptide (TPR) repeat protein